MAVHKRLFGNITSTSIIKSSVSLFGISIHIVEFFPQSISDLTAKELFLHIFVVRPLYFCRFLQFEDLQMLLFATLVFERVDKQLTRLSCCGNGRVNILIQSSRFCHLPIWHIESISGQVFSSCIVILMWLIQLTKVCQILLCSAFRFDWVRYEVERTLRAELVLRFFVRIILQQLDVPLIFQVL